MNMKKPSLGKRVFSNTFFLLADQVILKASTIVSFIILVRLLSHVDIAAVGICSGYLVLLTYLDISPIRVLLRDYARVSSDRVKRDELLTALFSFWFVQTAGIIILCLVINYFVLVKTGISGITFLFIAITIDYLALTFKGWIKMVFYADFKQLAATSFSFFVMFIRLGSFCLLFLLPTLLAYSWILIFLAIGECLMWGILFLQKIHFKPIIRFETINILKNSLTDYGLWDHGNKVVVNTLFTIDTAILSWFSGMREISYYAIALRFTSLFFNFSAFFSNGLQIALSNITEKEKIDEVINTFIKINFLVSFAQLIFMLLLGNWCLHFLFGADLDKEVTLYATIITVGITIMNLGFPLISVINTFCVLKRAFISVFLPGLIIGMSIYVGCAYYWGAIGMAWGNVVVYSMLLIGIIIFIRKYYPFHFNGKIISPREKLLLRELFSLNETK